MTVISRLLSRSHVVVGVEVMLSQPVPGPELEVEQVPPSAVLVSDLPPGCTNEFLEMYFESKKKSGGGDVEKVEMFPDRNEAVITFESSDGMLFVRCKTCEQCKGMRLNFQSSII